ncbi:MAG: metallophosphoesterase family protein [Ilumatobacteraceae bacterium]
MKRLPAIAVIVGGLIAAGGTGGPARASAVSTGFSFAVIGDIPYGTAQIAAFPKRIAQINADVDVRMVMHVGDIKNGSSLCSDAYYSMIRSNFDKFVDPLVYTPGDNEWTDCHTPLNGRFDPLKRLATVRTRFFPRPGFTLGQHPMTLRTQANLGLPENVRFDRVGVPFAALHVVGSNNGLANRTGRTAPTVGQAAEVQSRTAADIRLIKETFAHAIASQSPAVVLVMQADMFSPSVSSPRFADYSAFKTIVQTIALRAAAFGKPVVLFNGDSHVFRQDHPLAAKSSWLSFYGVTTSAPNLTRVTVDGSTAVSRWLKVTINVNTPNVASWVRVPFVA